MTMHFFSSAVEARTYIESRYPRAVFQPFGAGEDGRFVLGSQVIARLEQHPIVAEQESWRLTFTEQAQPLNG